MTLEQALDMESPMEPLMAWTAIPLVLAVPLQSPEERGQDLSS